MPNQVYKLRYKTEVWGKIPEEIGEQAQPGIRVTENWGYTDHLFVASILSGGSILLMDSQDGISPSRDVLEAVRDAINHHLEYHC